VDANEPEEAAFSVQLSSFVLELPFQVTVIEPCSCFTFSRDSLLGTALEWSRTRGCDIIGSQHGNVFIRPRAQGQVTFAGSVFILFVTLYHSSLCSWIVVFASLFL